MYHYARRDYRVNQLAPLVALEEELGRPIRVLRGRGRTYTEQEWSDPMVAACEPYSREDCEQRGITVVDYATSMAPIQFCSPILHRPLLGEYLAERNGYEQYSFYDSLKQATDDPCYEPYVPEGAEEAIASVGDRVVLLGLSGHMAQCLIENGYMQIEPCLLAPIRICIEEDRAEKMKAAAAEAMRKRLKDYVMTTSKDGIGDLIKELGSLQQEQSIAVATLARTKEEMRQRQRTLDYLLDADDDPAYEKALKSWDAMHEDPRIESVKLLNGATGIRIEINTVGLDISHPVTGKTAYLGKMRWMIDVATTTMEVHNLDNAKGGFDHPHVYMNRPCFGNLGEGIHRLIKQGELYAAVEMIFTFLGSVNLHDDWSRRASFWLGDGTDNVRTQPIVVEDGEPLTEEDLARITTEYTADVA